MRKFTKLWQLMIVLLLTSSIAMAQKSNTLQNSLSDKSSSETAATFEKPMSNEIYDPSDFPTPKQGGDDIASAVVIEGGLPVAVNGTTSGYTNYYDEVCPYEGSTSPDVVYSYTPATDESVMISLCNDGTAYDTKLYVYDTPTPATGDAIACNDDACSTAQSDYVSEIEQVSLTGGTTYYIVVDGYGDNSGIYFLTMTAVVPPPDCVWGVDIVCPEGAVAESELCGEDLNGGCNMDVPTWEPVPAAGGTVCGTFWADAGMGGRDTDWYEITLTTESAITINADATSPMFIFEIVTGTMGTPDCETAAVGLQATVGPCAPGSFTTAVYQPGTYWFFAGSTVFEGFPCDQNYWMEFVVETAGCPDPTDLGVSNLTETTADLVWTSTTGLSNLEFGLQGFTVGVDPIVSVTGVMSPYMVSELVPMDYDFYVQDDCGGGDVSSWAGPFTFTFTGLTFDAPTDLVGVVDVNDVTLNWTAPGGGGEGEWFQWDDGMHVGQVGLGTSAGTFAVASRWLPSELTAYDGMTVTKLSFLPADIADFKLMIWTGENAGTLVMEQVLATYVMGEFNIIDLDTPVTIDASMEYWFGYEAIQPANSYPAGRDTGPAIAFSGDMLSISGGAWISMFDSYGFDYNWNIAMFAESADKAAGSLTELKKMNYSASTASVSVFDTKSDKITVFSPSSSKALTGYNVFRDALMIDYTTETTYLDMDLAPGTYDYCVTAVYDEGESSCSNTISVMTDPASGDPPTNVTATKVGDTDVHVDWDAPGGGGAGLLEDFEGGVMPEGWASEGVNTDVSSSIPGYFTVTDYTSADVIPFGTYHAGLWWSYENQEEWLITPEFACTGTTSVEFWACVFESSVNGDHYKLQASIDGGTTWDVLWDATDLLGNAWNYYDYSYVVDLSAYAGQNVTLGFNCHDGDTDDGLWYIFFVDDVTVSDGTKSVTFNEKDFTYSGAFKSIAKDGNTEQIVLSQMQKEQMMTKSSKELTGYNVFRNGVFQANTVDTEFDDMGLADGNYVYCVSAVYDEGESDQVCAPSVHIGEAQSTFSDDFEDGDDNWVFTGDWGLTEEYSYSTSHSLTDSPGGNYLPEQETYATMANGVDLSDPAILSSAVSWMMIMDIESGDFDYVYVEASDDDFATFIELASFFGEGMLDPWVEYSYSLGSFVGSDNVKVRFHFSSDGGYEVDGCYIDDFAITISDVDEAAPEIFFDAPFAYEANLGNYEVNAVITDVTGVAGSVVKYTLDGDEQTDIVGVNTGGDAYQFTIPLSSANAGAQIDFQIEATDSSPAANVALSDVASFISGDYLGYDNAVVNFYTEIASPAGTAVKFTMEDDHSMVTALIRNYADQSVGLSDEMTVHIWDDGGNGPGADLITPITMFPEADLVNTNAFTRIDLRDYAGIGGPLAHLVAGDVIYVGFTVPSGIVRTTITQPGSGLQSYTSADGSTWAPTTDDFHYRIILGDFVTAIEDNKFNSNTQIYPNPATDIVNIKSDMEISNVKVFNSTGQLVSNEQVSGKLYQLNTSQFESGMYFFQIESNKGVISERIIIQ